MGKTNKPAPKTLGQIAHEAGEKHDGWARRWSDCSESQKAAWELIAADVAQAERERCALVCESHTLWTRKVHAGINGQPVKPCEVAAEIRKG